MLNENIKKRPLSGKFPILKYKSGEKPKIDIQNNNKLNEVKEIGTKLKKNEDKIDTKLYTKTFAETKENNNTNSSINQITDKTDFLEMLSKQKESEKEAIDNIIIAEANRIKNVNNKRKKLNEINLLEKNYDDLYIWQNLFNHSRPLSHYTTLKNRKIKKVEENKGFEEFKAPVILVDLHEDQMNLYFGENNFLGDDRLKKKIKSAKYDINKNILINKKKSQFQSINSNINSTDIAPSINNKSLKNHSKNNSNMNNTLKSKKSSSARNRIMNSLNSRKIPKNKKNKGFF